MLGLFNPKKEDLLIPNPQKNSAQYKMNTQSTFIMGIENKPLTVQTESILQIKQSTNDDSIETIVTVENITGNTPNKELEEHLQKTFALSKISKTLVFQRDTFGQFIYIKNKTKLRNEWENWKKKEIHKLFKEKKEQEKFIINYEKGLDNIDESILLSFQNSIIIPPLYGFKSYQNKKNAFNSQYINSKLIPDLSIKYQLCALHTEVNNIGEAKVNLKSKIFNVSEMKSVLEEMYEKSKDFSFSNYQFGIYLDYVLERETGKILNCKFSLTEIVHDNLRYDLKINLKEVLM